MIKTTRTQLLEYAVLIGIFLSIQVIVRDNDQRACKEWRLVSYSVVTEGRYWEYSALFSDQTDNYIGVNVLAIQSLSVNDLLSLTNFGIEGAECD